MSIKWPKTGPNFTPAYQVSGIPFVTSSLIDEVPGIDLNSASPEPISVSFPFVTKYVTIRNTGANELRVAFSKQGIFAPGERFPASIGGTKGVVTSLHNRNYFLIPSASSTKAQNPDTFGTVVTLDVRCKKMFFMSDAANNTPASAHATGFSLLAGLTTIHHSDFPDLTGSVDGSTAFEGIG